MREQRCIHWWRVPHRWCVTVSPCGVVCRPRQCVAQRWRCVARQCALPWMQSVWCNPPPATTAEVATPRGACVCPRVIRVYGSAFAAPTAPTASGGAEAIVGCAARHARRRVPPAASARLLALSLSLSLVSDQSRAISAASRVRTRSKLALTRGRWLGFVGGSGARRGGGGRPPNPLPRGSRCSVCVRGTHARWRRR